MSADANGIFLVGRLTRDAESKVIGDNTVHEFRVAFTTRERVNGEWGDKSNYVGVSYWGAPGVAQYLTKGRQVAITGSLVYREWQSSNGDRRSVNEIRARDVQLLGGQQPDAPVKPVGDDEEIPF